MAALILLEPAWIWTRACELDVKSRISRRPVFISNGVEEASLRRSISDVPSEGGE